MYTKILALALFLGVNDVTSVKLTYGDDSEPHGRNMDTARW